jgi:hypothetical protein
VIAGEDCIVLGLASFPMRLSVWVASNTVYAQMHARAGAFEVASRKCAHYYYIRFLLTKESVPSQRSSLKFLLLKMIHAHLKMQINSVVQNQSIEKTLLTSS